MMGNKKDMKRSFRLTTEEAWRLDMLCEMDDRTPSNMIAHLINKEFRTRKKEIDEMYDELFDIEDNENDSKKDEES